LHKSGEKNSLLLSYATSAAVFTTTKTSESSAVVAADSIVVDSLASLGESNVYDAADSNQVPEIIPEDTTTKRGLWSIFFYRFLSGFAALLTPCVFL
jgi:thiol:disulfide interchange protein DsbD